MILLVTAGQTQSQVYGINERMQPSFDQANRYFSDQAGEICRHLDQELGIRFVADPWQSDLGEGVVRTACAGECLEKASVNFSNIAGVSFPSSGLPDDSNLAGAPFKACGISLILHPLNPFVPTTHLNIRLLMVTPDGQPPVWWFGGGFDLTPFFPFDDDCYSWHQHAADLCRPYGQDVYADFKRGCDDYFFLPHRQETRGVGGLFFDRLNQWGWSKCFGFARDLVPTWLKAWLQIAHRRRNQAYSESQRNFQLFRRGRYVEFNLLYDRGTLFGLQSGGRIEAILASLPPLCRWGYCLDTTPGEYADFASLLQPYLRPRQWLRPNDHAKPDSESMTNQ